MTNCVLGEDKGLEVNKDNTQELVEEHGQEMLRMA